jgi:hypothetical protein
MHELRMIINSRFYEALSLPCFPHHGHGGKTPVVLPAALAHKAPGHGNTARGNTPPHGRNRIEGHAASRRRA